MQAVQNSKINMSTFVGETKGNLSCGKQDQPEIGELLQNSSANKKQLEEELKKLEDEQMRLMIKIKECESKINDKKAKKEYMKESALKTVRSPFLIIPSMCPLGAGIFFLVDSLDSFTSNGGLRDGLKYLGLGTGLIAGTAVIGGIAAGIGALVGAKKYKKTLESDIDKYYLQLENLTEKIADITNKL